MISLSSLICPVLMLDKLAEEIESKLTPFLDRISSFTFPLFRRVCTFLIFYRFTSGEFLFFQNFPGDKMRLLVKFIRPEDLFVVCGRYVSEISFGSLRIALSFAEIMTSVKVVTLRLRESFPFLKVTLFITYPCRPDLHQPLLQLHLKLFTTHIIYDSFRHRAVLHRNYDL